MKVNFLFIFSLFINTSLLAQQKGIVKGIVKTSDGLPAAYVNVILKDTNRGASTNGQGEYSIRNVDPGNYTLLISAVGLEAREQTIHVMSGETTFVPEIILNESAEQLREVVVTDEKVNPFSRKQSDYVSKMSLDDMENAQVYTTITKELLREQLVFSVDDAIKNAPGLQRMWEATGRSGDGGAYYNSRGFILQSKLRNGVAGDVSSRIDAANLESIEVVKGPSATLFGNTLTSYGGLINRITKKPYEKFGGEIAYAAGSYGFTRISADVNAPLNKERNVLMRLNAAYNYEGTFQDNGFEKGFVIAPSVSYQVNDRLSFSVDAEFYRGDNTSRSIIFFYYPTSQLGASSPDELGIDYERAYSSNDIFQTYRSSNFFVQMNYKLSDHWTSQTNFTSTHSFSDGPYAYFYVLPNAVYTGNPDATGADYLVRADQSTEGSEIQVKEFQQNFIGEFSLGSLKNRMVIGLDLFSQNSNQVFYGANFDVIYKNGSYTEDGSIPNYEDFTRTNLNAVLAEGTWRWPYKYKTNTYSAYVTDVINLTDNFLAMIALRFDRFDNEGSDNDGSGNFTEPYAQNVLSPKMGLVYQPVKDKVSLFANYQNGFTNQTGTDFLTNKTFKPECANQIEGGVKFDLAEGKVSTTLSYYDIRVENIVRAYYVQEDPNARIQDGAQVSRGFEADVIANPIHGLNVVAGFSYNDSKLEKTTDTDVLDRRPSTAMSPYTANAWISYRLLQGILKGFGVGIGSNYASDNKIMNSVSMGEFVLPAYTIYNAAVFYDNTKFRLGLKVDNLANERYWIGYTTMNPQKLRSFTGSLTVKF